MIGRALCVSPTLKIKINFFTLKIEFFVGWMPESEDGTTHDGFSEDEEGFDFDAYVTQNLNVS